MVEPLAWFVTQISWLIVSILLIAFTCLVPLVLLWIGWGLFKEQMIRAGVKEEWVKRATDWYFRFLVRYFKFWFFDLPVFLHRSGRSLWRKISPWIRANLPSWGLHLKRAIVWCVRALRRALKFFFFDLWAMIGRGIRAVWNAIVVRP